MVNIKTKEEIEILREGGKILSAILHEVAGKVKPGAGTEQLEKLACALMEKAGGRPSFKNYEISNGRFFPTALCISVNNQVVHGAATPNRILNEGEIVSLDIGMEWPVMPVATKKFKVINKYSLLGGFYTDMAITVPVGKIDKKAKKLIEVTKRSLEIAIAEAKPGKSLNSMGRAIQKYVEKNGFNVVRDLVGHGVGYAVHEEGPEVFNFEFKEYGIPDTILKPGAVIAIEPMVTMGDYRIKTGQDGLSIVTSDGSLAAHFEHTIAITEKGNIIITE